MDGDSSPYIMYVPTVLALVLLAILAAVILLCRETLAEKLKELLQKNEPVNPDEVEEEIISMVKESHEQGVLQDSEAEMIHNIFEFDDKEAKDIMTHRKNIVALSGETSFTDALGEMLETQRSRYPVYEDDIDHIIGVLHIKDAFAFVQRNELFRTSIKDIPALIREVDFVPETIKINELFRSMQSVKNHMVIVVDEYGQTAGIVAMEDILEEIVGNIEDEHDEEEIFAVRNADGSYQMDGLMEFQEAVELLEMPVEEESFDTLNGYLISILKKVPAEEEKPVVVAGGYEFSICRVEDRVIREVHVRKLTEEEQKESTEDADTDHTPR